MYRRGLKFFNVSAKEKKIQNFPMIAAVFSSAVAWGNTLDQD